MNSTLRITRAVVYADGRPAARILYSGRMIKLESMRGSGLGRLLPAGFTQGLPDDGSGRYDLWTCKHPHVHVPSDVIVAENLTLEDAVARLMEGALSGVRLPVLLLPGLQHPGAAAGPRRHRRRRHPGGDRVHPRRLGPAPQEQEAVAVSFRRTFSHPAYIGRRGGWFMDQRTGPDEWETVPVSSLVGQVVNIGDKDGGVYEGVTVTAFDEARGYLTLEGGVHGSCLLPDEARPLEHLLSLHVHDVARGFLCK